MAALKAGEVEAFLKRPDPRYPLVLIYGADQGLVSERARLLARSAVTDPDDPFQLIRMDADQLASDPLRFVDEAYTVPMFGGKRCILLRMYNYKFGRSSDEEIDEIADNNNEVHNVSNGNLITSIKTIVNNPTSDCLIIIEASNLKPTNQLRNIFEKSKFAIALPCFSDDDRNLSQLVDDELKKRGLQIDSDAKAELLDRLGADRLVSRNEIDKLALFITGRNRISLADVEAMMADTGAVSLDRLIDAVFVGQSGEADEMLRRCLAEHLDEGVIIGALLRHAILLQQSRAMLDQGKSMMSVEQSARLHFKRKKPFERQVTVWKRDALETAITHLFEAQTMVRKTPALGESLISRCCLQLSLAAKRRA